MLQINETIGIPEDEMQISAIRSQGAGGQNVNKVATAVQLRFDINRSSLPDQVKKKLLNFADKRITRDGFLIIKAQEHRSQARNRITARERLRDIIARACYQQKTRVSTSIPKKSKMKRLENKSHRAVIKRLRTRTNNDE